ncbi:tetratricopeptide repeat protein [Microvirga pudoricolor]|uniref:tetratricopeptide repeat protein n=1 Tax=Microvirga pudoricolor TaxID=2778729 RepID=UPI00194E8C6B|nr:tetratricopeptide repeat protein [Microvirga pudoricolor]MBM6596070.1 tetratricopeptide repeat protein [Microvirga pudoricolor]
MRHPCIVLAVVVSLGVGFQARAELVKVAPNVRIEKRIFPADDEEAPFSNLRDKSADVRRSERAVFDLFLNKGIGRVQAAGMVGLAAWRAFHEGDLRQAGFLFNQACVLEPRHSVSYHGFAAIAAKRFNDLDYADRLLTLAERMLEPSDEIFTDHGLVLLKARRLQEARERLGKAVRMSPDQPAPALYLAAIHLQLGDRAEAC